MDKPDLHVTLHTDDSNLIVTNECFNIISEILQERSYNASINKKSNGLWYGAWKNRRDTLLRINSEGLIFFSCEMNYWLEKHNWNNLESDIQSIFMKLLIMFNACHIKCEHYQLCASKLYHKLARQGRCMDNSIK